MFYAISDAAHQVPCSAATLRVYEKKGIISPLRDSGGRRLLTDKDIEAARNQMGNGRKGRPPLCQHSNRSE